MTKEEKETLVMWYNCLDEYEEIDAQIVGLKKDIKQLKDLVFSGLETNINQNP